MKVLIGSILGILLLTVMLAVWWDSVHILMAGAFVGAALSWYLTRLYYSAHAKAELKEGAKSASDAGKELIEKAKEAIDNRKGSVSRELLKYLSRFGFVLLAAFMLMVMLRPDQLNTVLYKVGLSVIAIGVAELSWILFFKPFLHRTEDIRGYEKRTVLWFRGMLYAAIILSLCLGL